MLFFCESPPPPLAAKIVSINQPDRNKAPYITWKYKLLGFKRILDPLGRLKSPKKLLIFTARKQSCGKVMFLNLSVILFTGGGVSVGGGLCPREGRCPRGSLCPGGLCPGGGVISGRPPVR